MNTEENKQHWYKSPWIIGWLSLVIVVLIVNGYMIMQSINNFPGLVVEDFYDRGQDYEENINTKLENNKRWLPEFTLAESIELNQQTSIKFKISDKSGNAVVAEKLTLFVYRPSNSKKDFSIPMQISSDKQTYQAQISFPLKGKWDLLASAIIDGIEVNYPNKVFVKE
jgi:nitrogen fixation protein FixH